MRMWNVDPEWMCDKHLLGEHVEMHMFVGTLNKGMSIQGYIDGGLVDPHWITQRHELLAAEMVRRGMRHDSPLPPIERNLKEFQPVLLPPQTRELTRRCAGCRAIIEAATRTQGGVA